MHLSMRVFEKGLKIVNGEVSLWQEFTLFYSFFIVSWFYLGYTIKVTNSETLYLKYKLKKKGIKYLFSIISHVLRKKQLTSF